MSQESHEELKKYVESHGGIHAVRGGGPTNRSWPLSPVQRRMNGTRL